MDHKIPFKKIQLDFLKIIPAEDIKEFLDCPETNRKDLLKKIKNGKINGKPSQEGRRTE